MRLLLINKNPVVSRMMQMSVPKAGFEIEECESVYDLPSGKYEVVVIDDEMYDENFLHDINQNIKYYQIGIITSSKSDKFDNFDFVLSKPFLPTDLIEVLRKVRSEIESQKETLPLVEEEGGSELEQFLKANEERDELLEEKEPVLEESAPLFEEERIVEIEEEVEEESPFVTENLEKSGVLKEDDVEEVSQLLSQDEPALDERVDFSAFDQEKSSFEESLKIGEPEPQIEPEPEPGVVPLKEENIFTEAKSEDFSQKVPDEPVNSLSDIEDELKRLDIASIKKILDGMKIDITIKISYPDRDDV